MRLSLWREDRIGPQLLAGKIYEAARFRCRRNQRDRALRGSSTQRGILQRASNMTHLHVQSNEILYIWIGRQSKHAQQSCDHFRENSSLLPDAFPCFSFVLSTGGKV